MKKTNECTTIIIKFGDFTSAEQTGGDIKTVAYNLPVPDNDTIEPVGEIGEETLPEQPIAALPPAKDEEIEADELEDDKTGQEYDEEGEEELIVQDNESIIFNFQSFLEKKRNAPLKPDKERIKKAENLKRSVKLAPNIPVINPPNMR